MAAQTQDKFQKKGASTVTTLSAPGKAIGAGSITVGSTTNYPTDTGITIAIRVVDTNGDLVAGTYTEWNAIVASGTSFTIDTTPAYGSDQIYAAGSTTQVFIPLSSYSHNKMIDALLTEHNQDGSLKTLWTQYVPVNSGFSSTSTNVGRYSRVGSIASVYLTVVGTSNTGYIGLELPYPPKSTAFIPARVLSGGVNLDDPGMIEITAGSTAAVVYRSFSGGTFVTSGAKALHPINFTYEIDE